MIDEADRDGDGEVGEEDFLRIMKKVLLILVFYLLFIFRHLFINVNNFKSGQVYFSYHKKEMFFIVLKNKNLYM
jgi:hypothetical protein